MSIRSFSLSTIFNADEESRKTRSALAFQELTSSVSKPVRRTTDQKPSANSTSTIIRHVEVIESSSGQRQAPRNLKAVRQSKKEGNSPRTRGIDGKPSSAGLAARGIAARFSARVRRDKNNGGNSSQSRNRSLRGVPRKPRLKPWEEEKELPYTEEETEYADARDGGFTTPYNPDTNEQNLARNCPAVISNDQGMVDSIRYRLAVATDNISPQYRIATQHLMRIVRGKGTLFEDPKQKGIFQEWKDKLDREIAEYKGIPFIREELGSLPKKTQDEIIKQWVGGQYDPPALISPENPITYVRNYAKRNETWLPEDTKKFEAKLASLLPSSMFQGN